jgi:Glutathione S-transferase, N-terminal domain
MKIYGDVRSANCDKVRFTVDYLRLSYEWVEVDSVAGGTRTPEFLAMNPQGQLPVVQLSDGRFLDAQRGPMRQPGRSRRTSIGTLNIAGTKTSIARAATGENGAAITAPA